MVVRAVLASILILLYGGLAAQGKLAIYDFSWEDQTLSLSNDKVIDSLTVADDQPSFHPTDPLLLFVRKVDHQNAVVSFNYSNGEERILYESPSALASPKITPDTKYLSILEGEKKNLVKIALTDGNVLPLSNLSMDGYCWIDVNSLLIIQPGDPNTLSLVTLRPLKIMPVARHVGRVIQQSKNIIAFVHKLSVDAWSIKQINSTGNIQILAETLPEADLFALAPGGKVLMLNEEKIFGYVPSADWAPLEIPGRKNRAKITHIGLSPSGDKLFILSVNP
jgi:hypothetical protein